ncbi:MAG: glycosyltransferase family 4 protein, partial [Candidatus Marsarchaeota archaeon]|nr:glycosyltransferase family 4 protein [Candidatus Marsarchaeota archaeon]
QAYFFDRRPRIVTAVCENLFGAEGARGRFLSPLLWRRLDGLLGVAAPSIEGIRAVGMPSRVPAFTLVAGAISPAEEVQPLRLPFSRPEDVFVLGFAGRLCEEKGWKVLLSALRLLPASVKCVIAGDGPQLAELQVLMDDLRLRGRVFYLGLLPKAELWRFYRSLNALVLPSLTFPHLKEQFGGVLADAMALGVPIIGSNSGAIPEVTGPAGLIVPENDPAALAQAIHCLTENPLLWDQLAKAGPQRFESEFAIPAYARKIAKGLRLMPR